MFSKERLANAFRRWGYLQADLDPLGRLEPFVHADLQDAGKEDAERWHRIYCGSIGVEFMHIHFRDRCEWVARRMEEAWREPNHRSIVRRLAEAELLERFIHQRYVGTKRYSLEGCAAVIPLLDAVLDISSQCGARRCLIGMSHRGRLNVMVNVVGRPARDLFAHFQDNVPRGVLGGGDVRYHLGATGEHVTASGQRIRLHLVSNPSHLEAVGPVMMGRAKARQDRIGPKGRRSVLPLLIHGDAALAGQGIAAEALNLDGVDGFGVGGTVHVVINNLIGFTTSPASLHASRYATDVAKRLPIPIFHVNGDDPEAVIRAAEIATAYRYEFETDVVVDLIGFRRYGHSEVDDPSATQPLLYRQIQTRPMLWRTYGEKIMDQEELERLEGEILEKLGMARDEGKKEKAAPTFRTLPEYWSPFVGGRYRRSLEVDTGVPRDRLVEIATRITVAPDDFHLHDKVAKGLALRRQMGTGKRPVDWGTAEALAIGSLLWEGTPVRLVGEDSRRGTFNHRHAVLFDVQTGEEHVPLDRLQNGQARFSVHDTPLSEAAAVGFEYGYSRDYPEALVCWEAQFGDFANGAQVILDQFVSAGEDKWGLLSGLVLLLPHGHEGQGPEHSSARVERFLQLAAEDDIQVCQPSTAGQYFHLLRRQALRAWRKPLVMLTPKSLLRAEISFSPLEELTSDRFRPVLGDSSVERVQRVLLCSGKIAHELAAERERRSDDRTAVIRLEELFPFPDNELTEVLRPYAGVREFVWVQEEPANMGALSFVRPRLQALIGDRHLRAVKRTASASPATGSLEAHRMEQRRLLELAFGPRGGTTVAPIQPGEID
jgi:2-oxoglutarate dehydrogenase E1 component